MVGCGARALCLAENLAGRAVLQPQKAAEKAESLATYSYSFCCTEGETAEDVVSVPEIPKEHQGTSSLPLEICGAVASAGDN